MGEIKYITINGVTYKIKATGTTIKLVQTTGDGEDVVMSQKAVTDALGEKVDKKTTATTGAFAYAFNKNGSIAQEITFTAKEWTIAQYRTGGRLRVADPDLETDAANKKYVDEIDRALRAELGLLVETVEMSGDRWEGFKVPDGALPNIYIDSPYFEYTYTDYSVTPENMDAVTSREYTALYFYDAGNNLLGEAFVPSSDGFYEMPEGTVKIMTNIEDILMSDWLEPSYNAMGAWYSGKITFQVKVEA